MDSEFLALQEKVHYCVKRLRKNTPQKLYWQWLVGCREDSESKPKNISFFNKAVPRDIAVFTFSNSSGHSWKVKGRNGRKTEAKHGIPREEYRLRYPHISCIPLLEYYALLTSTFFAMHA
jgi:hypothetical protein